MKKILSIIFWIFLILIMIGICNLPKNKINDETKKEETQNFNNETQITEINLDGTLKENLKKALKEANMDYSKINGFYKANDWENGPRYEFRYVDKSKNTVYFVYAYDDGQIVSITTGTKEVYRNSNIKVENNDTEAIILTYGQLGDYGKYVKFDGKKYMRYVLPAGKYEVTALIKNSMFFIEKTKIYKNSFGYDETKTVSSIQLTDVGSTETITLKKDEWINLTMNSSISIKEIK